MSLKFRYLKSMILLTYSLIDSRPIQ